MQGRAIYTLRPLSHKRMCSILDQRYSFIQMSRRALLIDADSGKFRVRLCRCGTFDLPIASSDAQPLSYRRHQAIKLSSDVRESGFRIPESSKCEALESGIHCMESRIHTFRWNPGSISVQPVSARPRIRDPESTGWDLESEGHLHSFT